MVEAEPRFRQSGDPSLIVRGRGQFIDDVELPGMLYLQLVRSPLPHARIVGIETAAALRLPGVVAVITGSDLARQGLAWMPTLAGDRRPVLPIDEVSFQGQEVVGVVASDRYAAADAAAAVEVEYDPLPGVADPLQALDADAPLVRPDRSERTNLVWRWQAGDRDGTEDDFAKAAVLVAQQMHIPRVHTSAIESCGCVASWDSATGELTIWVTTHAPEGMRVVLGLIGSTVGIDPEKIRFVSVDIGGGAGGKILTYPGYLVAVAASLATGRPVKWIESRNEYMQAASFAGGYEIMGSLAADADGRMRAVRIRTVADRGSADVGVNPHRIPPELLPVSSGPYRLEHALLEVEGVYTNRAPGGVAYRRTARVTDTVFAIERLVDILAHDLGIDPAELRLRNMIPPEPASYVTPLGYRWESDDYVATLRKAMDAIGYAELRREQAERRAAGQLMGIGVASFTEALVGGPSRLFNILAARLVDPNASVGRVSAQYPFGSHICVVDLDGGSGELTIRRLVGVHGIGHQIDPLVLQGQIAGPLQSGFAPALYEEVVYDEFGGNLSSTLLSYAIPRAPESPDWEPEPRPPHGDGAAERISPGESPSVGAQVAIANAVVDALWHLGVRHVDIPITPSKVWSILRELEARMPASSGNARETHLTH